MLAMHPDVQAKVLQEIIKLNVTEPENMSIQTLSRHTYLEQVIKESLRLFPVFPLAARNAMSNVDIGPCVLKPGMSTVINIFSLHRRKDIWGENVNQFEPERFAEERMVDKHPYCFIPFSAGSRNCIGNQSINR
jgi:cytochrome P450